MRRVRGLEAGPDLTNLGDGVGVDLERALRDVIVVDEFPDAVVHEIGVAKIFGTVGEDALLHLGDEVDVLRRVMRDVLEMMRQVVLHFQELYDREAAGTGGWRRHDLEVAPGRAQRLAPYGRIGFQVRSRDQAVAERHLRNDQFRCLPAVEVLRTVLGDAAQRRREFGLPEGVPGLHEAEVGKEIGLDVEPVALLLDIGDECRIRQESLLSQFDGGHDEFFPRQGAVPLVRRPQPGDRAGHAGCLPPDQERLGNHVAVRVQVHVAIGRERRLLAVVEEFGLSVLVNQHEAAAADIARDRIRDRKREADRNRGVHRIAAAAQHVFGSLRAIGVADGNRSNPRGRRGWLGGTAAGDDTGGKEPGPVSELVDDYHRRVIRCDTCRRSRSTRACPRDARREPSRLPGRNPCARGRSVPASIYPRRRGP